MKKKQAEFHDHNNQSRLESKSGKIYTGGVAGAAGAGAAGAAGAGLDGAEAAGEDEDAATEATPAHTYI